MGKQHWIKNKTQIDNKETVADGSFNLLTQRAELLPDQGNLKYTGHFVFLANWLHLFQILIETTSSG